MGATLEIHLTRRYLQMEAKAKLFGHPIHQMLVVFPLGLLATSFFFDLAWTATRKADLGVAAYWMIFAGVIGALLAAVFGFIDWLSIPSGTRAKWIGAWHGSGNVIVAALFAVSWWLRRADPAVPSLTAIVLSGLAVSIAIVTGWLGGELVDQLGVGVNEGANLDAPNSITAHRVR
jgi:uncharacterized membrane protein